MWPGLSGFWFQTSQRGTQWYFGLSAPYLWRKSGVWGVWQWLLGYIYRVPSPSMGCVGGSVQMLDWEDVGCTSYKLLSPTLPYSGVWMGPGSGLPHRLLSGTLHQWGASRKHRTGGEGPALSCLLLALALHLHAGRTVCSYIATAGCILQFSQQLYNHPRQHPQPVSGPFRVHQSPEPGWPPLISEAPTLISNAPPPSTTVGIPSLIL